MEKKFDIMYFIRIAGVLFIICALSALLLSAVNSFTKDRIALNTQARMNESIAAIFGDGIDAKPLENIELTVPVNTVYEVYSSDGNKLGYAVYTVPTGFKGDIEMMVGVTLAGKCMSVEIISMSETPGVGTKVAESSFLDQYRNVMGELSLDGNIIPVAGATISSRAVNNGINEALKSVGGIIG